MEGTLFIPPERGTFIGRALWKARHVVVGPAHRAPATADGPSRQTGPNGPPSDAPGAIYLSIYKSKEDVEPVQQHAISSITECQVQMIAHRKQGPVLPTLVVNVSPDPTTDKLRKRRSSRTAGLTTTRETSPTTLWFRTAPDESHRLQEWSRYIQSLTQPYPMDRHPISPVTPSSPTFVNPFSPRSREPCDYPRPPSANHNSRTALQHKTSSQTYSSRERPVTFSEAPSLRSKRSDVSSSQTSSVNHPPVNYSIPGQHYTTIFPTDLPSPATTVGEYQGEFIEGWTSAQGRASTLSSPVRGRDSVSSQPVLPSQQPSNSSSPPGPRETILDRAFQLRVIPGSEQEIPGEEKLSSLARFDALMREADERRRRREAEEGARAARAADDARNARFAETGGLKSAWDLDEESDGDGRIQEVDEEDDDAHERDLDDDVMIPRTAQRALDYIAGRHQPTSLRSPISYDHDTLMVLNSGSSSQLRPQTGYSRSRPAIAQRTYSQPQLATAQRYLPHLASASGVVPEEDNPAAAAVTSHRNATEKHQSGSSAKRLSLTEFTRRLSSTSSLLLVQTNNPSNPSSRGSSVIDTQQQHSLSPSTRGVPVHDISAVAGDDDREKQCGWRGSVGVDGGFL